MAGPLDGSEPVWVQQGGAWKRTTSAAIAALAGVDLTDLNARIASLEKALKTEVGVRQAADDAQSGRLAALESRNEVAHFSASAALPTVAAAASFNVKLTALVPERAGDVVRKGELVDVRADLPAGITMGSPFVSTDGTVTVPLKAALAMTAGAPIPWSIIVLR